MLKIGITGGIGSGKTTICRIFRLLGVPVYDADRHAKRIMVENDELVAAIKHTFGNESYLQNGQLNRVYLAERVFNNEDELNKLNALVHPIVIKAADEWANAQHTFYTIKEAALLFESGSYIHNDINIVVSAPLITRIQRVMKRDGISEEQVRSRIGKQLPEEEKIEKADYVIYNDDCQAVIPQVLRLDAIFRKND